MLGILPPFTTQSFLIFLDISGTGYLALHYEATLLEAARQPLACAFQDLSALIIQRHLPQDPVCSRF